MKRLLLILLIFAITAALLLSACQPAEGPAEAPAAEEPAAEAEEPTAEAEEPAPAGPQVGGNLLFAVSEEPDTLDIYKSSFSVTSLITSFLGGALISTDVDGNYVPYLAESWEASEDGLSWTFHLKQDVIFHNGEPFTAHDYVWTWDRCRDPEFVCPVSGSVLAPITAYEALDDYTLVLSLDKPFYPILSTLAMASYLQPLNQKAVEEAGDQYGWTVAVGVGPYRLKEWSQDEKLVLERNPDFTWGPERFEGANTGPYYVETYEFRIVPDYGSTLAALEAGELDYASVQVKDVETIEASGNYQIFEVLAPAPRIVTFNLDDPVFSNVNLRKAFNLATDKESILQVAVLGKGVVIHTPISPGMTGYDPVVETYGYDYDLEAAKAMLEEEGYSFDENGKVLTPEGEPFQFTLKGTSDETNTKVMQLLVDQWTKLGVDVQIEQGEWGTIAPQLFGGQYSISTIGYGYSDVDVLNLMLHSSGKGASSFTQAADPDLDVLLDSTRTALTQEERQEAVNETVKYIMDNAMVLPMYTFYSYSAVSNRYAGVQFSPYTDIIISDMYYTGE